MKPELVVVGSINMDMVFGVDSLPTPGETVGRAQFALHPGGKGANQAVAAARMGAATAMVGCVGDDPYGQTMISVLNQDGVDCSQVRTGSKPTGCAGIFVDKQGENIIAVAPGANGELGPEDIERARELIAGARVLMVQIEVPLETVRAALKLAKEEGVLTILDPAPARLLDQELLALVDVITPNCREASVLTGEEVHCWQTAAKAARELRDQGVKNVLVTMGKFGAFYSSARGEVRISAPQVIAKDSTAAGDAFNGALAAAVIRGAQLDEAADFAAAAGAVAATRPGAQPSLPTLIEIAQVVNLPWRE